MIAGPLLIRMRAIRRDYAVGNGTVHALDGIDLEVARGEIVSLMGASGSGKSTLLNVIGFLDRPTSGSYQLEGREVSALSEGDREEIRRFRIGFVFQSFHLVPRLTAVRNVEFPMIFAGVPREERSARAARALEGVGLLERRHHRPDQLSGGERQRVALARALVGEPDILLADEPTGNLDSRAGAEIVALLREIGRSGRTVILVTHNPEVASVGDRILEMKDGRLI